MRGYQIAFWPGPDDLWRGNPTVSIPPASAFIEVFDDEESAIASLRKAQQEGSLPAAHYVKGEMPK